eukprot:5213952-Prymnesium_polylepis.1
MTEISCERKLAAWARGVAVVSRRGLEADGRGLEGWVGSRGVGLSEVCRCADVGLSEGSPWRRR